MVGKLSRLPVKTLAAIQQLSCIGNSADFGAYAICQGTSEDEMHADLWDALRLELVMRLENSYRFAHDRIQEAAYSLIPEGARAAAHLRIGRLLTDYISAEKREEAIFEIVGQLNRGAVLAMSDDERERIAELNLLAGKRAKASTAYASSLKYLESAAALLAEDCWERRHDLVFQLELNRAECEFLTGRLAEAEGRLATLSPRARSSSRAIRCRVLAHRPVYDSRPGGPCCCRLSRLSRKLGYRMVASSDEGGSAAGIRSGLVTAAKPQDRETR